MKFFGCEFNELVEIHFLVRTFEFENINWWNIHAIDSDNECEDEEQNEGAIYYNPRQMKSSTPVKLF